MTGKSWVDSVLLHKMESTHRHSAKLKSQHWHWLNGEMYTRTPAFIFLRIMSFCQFTSFVSRVKSVMRSPLSAVRQIIGFRPSKHSVTCCDESGVSLNRLLEALNSINSYHFCILHFFRLRSVLAESLVHDDSFEQYFHRKVDKGQFGVSYSSGDIFRWQQSNVQCYKGSVVVIVRWFSRVWVIGLLSDSLYRTLYSVCTVYCTHVTPVSDSVARGLSDWRQRRVTTQHKPDDPGSLVSRVDIVWSTLQWYCCRHGPAAVMSV